MPDRSPPRRQPPARTRLGPRALRAFLDTEAAGGVVLVAATLIALAWANSPWAAGYETMWSTEITLPGVGPAGDLRHWVNEGLMTLFFLLVGLEIKRELVEGELNEARKAALPALAAVGGMVVPALVYAAFNAGGEGAAGWGIPMATDIAFAVGVLALFGSRVPTGLKVFLLSLAIVDDVGAIVVIAVFYASEIEPVWLAVAAVCLVSVWGLRKRIRWTPLYALIGMAVWFAMLRSGVHATLAGVAMGLLAPVNPAEDTDDIAERMETFLHPWSSFVIVPLFALANAGVGLSGGAFTQAPAITLGVVAGLVAGKLVGVAGASWLSLRAGIAEAPDGVSWLHLVGGAAIAGIGFTVSLFITTLAFEEAALVDAAKVGVLLGSVVAGLVGALILVRARPSS